MNSTFNYRDFAIKMLSGRQSDQMSRDCLSMIRNGDDSKGQELADKLCESNGVTREQALEQAKNFFGFR